VTAKVIFRLARTVVLSAVILLAGGWLVFVPWAKEPPYQFVTAWGGKGSAPGQFSDPTGIAVAGDEVFVSDSRNGRIQVFDLDGHFKRQFGAPGEKPGQLGRPMNLAVYGNELYVAEYFNDRVQVFALDGTPKRVIGKSGSGAGEFNAPGGVAVASNGDLFVADFYNQRVQQLKADGSFVRQWGRTGKSVFGRASSIIPPMWRSAPTARCTWRTATTTAFRSSTKREISVVNGADHSR
jgi:hypothetical protein